MLLYIHVPFCRKRCGYCSFHSESLASYTQGQIDTRMRTYMDTLHLEIAKWHDTLGRQKVESVFFGGGTPSLLPLKIISSTLDKIRLAFDVADHAEITLEGNPESLLRKAQLHEYKRIGINRLSIGMQAMDNTLLDLLGRIHKAEDAVQAFSMARDAGFNNINLDLMWGLPSQRIRHWLDVLERVASLKPDHFSLYGLTLEEGTPLAKECDEGDLVLPSERDQSLMFMRGADILESHGFMHYEISNFARMGFQCKHNLGYWSGKDYLGIGPSATSTINQRRWTNPWGFGDWGRAVSGGYLDEHAEELDIRKRAAELIMLRLRTSQGLRLKDYEALTGRDFMTDHKQVVQALHQNNLVRIMNGFMRLTRNGMLVSNNIISHLFAATQNLSFTESPQQLPKPKQSVKIFGGKKRLSEL